MVQRPIRVDLDKVKTTGGDFNEGALDMALLEADIVGKVCDAVNELARDKKAIIFTVSVKQAELIAERLRLTTIATTDRRHFSTIRPTHVEAFELLP